MATERSETTIGEEYSVTLPPDLRDRLDIRPGDKLRWETTDESDLQVEVVRQRYGAFDDAEPVDLGVDSLEAHDLAGDEREHLD